MIKHRLSKKKKKIDFLKILPWPYPLNVDDFIRTVTTRVWPGCVSTTLASSHLAGGSRGFFINVRSFALIIERFAIFDADETCASRSTFQKCSCIACILCHRDKRFLLTSRIDSSGTLKRERPIKKCPGVRASKESGSFIMMWKGGSWGKLRSDIRESNSNWDKVSFPITRFKWCLKLFTPASQSPPKCGDAAGMKCHCIFSEARRSWTVQSLHAFINARRNLWSAPQNSSRCRCKYHMVDRVDSQIVEKLRENRRMYNPRHTLSGSHELRDIQKSKRNICSISDRVQHTVKPVWGRRNLFRSGKRGETE